MMLTIGDVGLILETVAVYFGLHSIDELTSPCRRPELVAARNVAAYILYEDLGLSYPWVGRILHRHHSLVLNGHHRIREQIRDGKHAVARVITDLRGTITKCLEGKHDQEGKREETERR